MPGEYFLQEDFKESFAPVYHLASVAVMDFGAPNYQCTSKVNTRTAIRMKFALHSPVVFETKSMIAFLPVPSYLKGRGSAKMGVPLFVAAISSLRAADVQLQKQATTTATKKKHFFDFMVKGLSAKK